MPGGFPQTIGVLAGASSGFTASLPLLAVPSGDGITGILQVGGIAATIGFPYGYTTDNQTAATQSGVGLMGWNSASVDRIRVANSGTEIGNNAVGVLVVQGTKFGTPVPMSEPYSYITDTQTPLAQSGVGIMAVNASGTIDRVRVANIGTDLGNATTGVLVIQGSSHGTPIPVSGSFTSSYPYTEASDGQVAAAASAVALAGYDPSRTAVDRIKTAVIGTATPAATNGVLVVQSSPNASPFPMSPIGQGALFAVPAGSANGTAIGVMPSGAQGIRIYVPPNCTFTYTVASAAPGAPPTQTVSFTNPTTSNTPIVVDENLSSSQNLYVTAPTVANAALVARWM